MVAAVVVAAGRGLRVGGDRPKQYRQILGEPVIRPSLAALAAHGDISLVQPVVHPDDAALYQAAVTGLELLPPVPGGATRQASVRAGLEALAARRPELVLVHDAARPFASAALITRAIAAARARGRGPGPARRRHREDGRCRWHGDRNDRPRPAAHGADAASLGFAALLAAHRRAQAAGRDDFTDDAALAEWAGLKVSTFEGEARNVKLTTTDDFTRAEAAKLAGLSDVRTGFGFDVHQFGAGDHVMLGGVRVAHDRGLSGHSDADVVLHALVDAILGALADGDIGVHFRPAIRNGAVPPPTSSSPSRSTACALAAGVSLISTSPWSARRRASACIATPSAPASPRSPACRSSASG